MWHAAAGVDDDAEPRARSGTDVAAAPEHAVAGTEQHNRRKSGLTDLRDASSRSVGPHEATTVRNEASSPSLSWESGRFGKRSSVIHTPTVTDTPPLLEKTTSKQPLLSGTDHPTNMLAIDGTSLPGSGSSTPFAFQSTSSIPGLDSPATVMPTAALAASTLAETAPPPATAPTTEMSFLANLIPEMALLFQQFIFLATGLLSTLVSQKLFYEHEARTQTMLTVLATYVGMACVRFLPASVGHDLISPSIVAAGNAEPIPPTFINNVFLFMWSFLKNTDNIPFRARRLVAIVAFMDVLGSCILAVGLFWVGSGLFQVIYASVIIFTAIGSKIFLKKALRWGQWFSIIVIMVGLHISSADHASTAEKEETREIGFVSTLLGTCIYSGVYIVNDHILSTKTITQRLQCQYVGVFSTFYTLLVMVVISIPSLVSLPWEQWNMYVGYFVLVLSGLFHNSSYFYIMNKSGAVATGVLQALRAVLVFFMSNWAFCSIDDQQCLTVRKEISTMIVVIGVLGFSISKASGSVPKDVPTSVLNSPGILPARVELPRYTRGGAYAEVNNDSIELGDR